MILTVERGQSRLRAMTTPLLGWLLVCGTLAVYLYHPAHDAYGNDFFSYWAAARASREASAATLYTDSSFVRTAEAAALAERLRSEGNPAVTAEWVLENVPDIPDPRFPGSPLPPRYYPEWTQIWEHSYNEPAKASPASFGLLKLLRIDRLPFREAFRLWNFISLAAVFLSIVLIRPFSKLPLPWALLLALWFDPVRSAFVYGNFVEIALLGACGFFFFLFGPRPRPVVAGLLLALSVLIKPLAGGLVIYLFWSLLFEQRRARVGRALAGFGLGSLFIVVLYESLLGPGTWLTWLATFPKWYSDYEFHLVSYANRSALAALIGWIDGSPSDPMAIIGHRIYTAIALISYAFVFLTRYRLTRSPLTAPALALIGSLIISKFVLSHYEVLLLIPFAILLGRTRTPRQSALLLALWIGFGFYETFFFLLSSRLEFFLYPALWAALLFI